MGSETITVSTNTAGAVTTSSIPSGSMDFLVTLGSTTTAVTGPQKLAQIALLVGIGYLLGR